MIDLKTAGSGIRIARVAEVHPHAHAIDVVYMDDGGYAVGIPVMTESASQQFGAAFLPKPDVPAYGKWSPDFTPPEEVDILAVIAMTTLQPVCLGFIHPQVGAMGFEEDTYKKNLRLERHPSDRYTMLDDDGNSVDRHPSGAFRAVGDKLLEIEEKSDWDEEWELKRNLERREVFYHDYTHDPLDPGTFGEHKTLPGHVHIEEARGEEQDGAFADMEGGHVRFEERRDAQQDGAFLDMEGGHARLEERRDEQQDGAFVDCEGGHVRLEEHRDEQQDGAFADMEGGHIRLEERRDAEQDGGFLDLEGGHIRIDEQGPNGEASSDWQEGDITHTASGTVRTSAEGDILSSAADDIDMDAGNNAGIHAGVNITLKSGEKITLDAPLIELLGRLLVSGNGIHATAGDITLEVDGDDDISLIELREKIRHLEATCCQENDPDAFIE
jgi:hypothetical protein